MSNQHEPDTAKLTVRIPADLVERVESGNESFDWGAYLARLIEEDSN